ncbi:hypothetical protein DH2020_019671 [Rehmannia glutinosa]|uniref:MULE transposase domain-containing protein n=1 Tax=Rehmannia glutinosa TaxID=99300 RepID=A0ABR0WDX8_REHGL
MCTQLCVDENCKWRLRATKFKDSDYFQIRKYTPEHTCALNLSTNDHRQARSWVIGKHIMSRFEDCNTTYRPAHVANEIRRDFGIEISYQKARRSRETALAYIRGSLEDSYTKLAAYAHNLKVANPGTIYSLEVDNENHFKYFFLAYEPCIRGFHSSIYPLAWVVVDYENDASWHWFFMNLKGIAGDQEDLVVISDRHRSLISAIQTVFQNAHHDHCIYHIKGNLRTVTRKTNTISLFNKAADAYTI